MAEEEKERMTNGDGEELPDAPADETQPLISQEQAATQQQQQQQQAQAPPPPPPKDPAEEKRELALEDFKKRLLEHREWDEKLKHLRKEIKGLDKAFIKTEDDMKALQSVGQIVGEILKQLDEERFIVKASSGPRYVVGCRSRLDKVKLKQGVRVALDMTTLTIMRLLPREVDPMVYNMSLEDPGKVSFEGIGGLSEQIRELRRSD